MNESTIPTIPDEIAEVLEETGNPAPKPEPVDPSLAELRSREQATLERFRDAIRTTDPMLDKVVLDLERHSVVLDAIVDRARRVQAQADAGLVPADRAAAKRAEARAKAERSVEDVVVRATNALTLGRSRLLEELVPDPGRSPEAGQAKGDLERAMLRFSDPYAGVQALFDEALQRRDVLEMRLLAGRFGRDLFTGKGGNEETWRALQRQFLQTMAQQSQRENPTSALSRKWNALLGDDADNFLVMAKVRLQKQLEQVSP